MPFTVLTLLGGPSMIHRASDSAFIPFDPSNGDYQDYLAWVSAGSPATWPARGSR